MAVSGVGTTGFVLALSWLSSVTAGHTKRVTVNAIMLSAYCVGNAAAPFMWQAKYQPRNHVPWTIIGITYVVCPALMLLIRWILWRENKRRDAEPVDDTYDDVYVEVITADGKRMEKKVSKVCSFLVHCCYYGSSGADKWDRNSWISQTSRTGTSVMSCRAVYDREVMLTMMTESRFGWMYHRCNI